MGQAAAVGERAVSGRLSRALPRDTSQRDDSTAADVQEADLDACIARLLDAAPPLSGEQRDILALLLRRPRRR
jgi:hypothetical protein